MKDGNQLVRVEQIAQLAGVTVRRVQQLTQEGIIKSEKAPGEYGRMYDFLPTVRNLLMYYREKADKRSGPSESMEAEKLRHESVKREFAELRVQRARGDLFDVAIIEKVIGAVFTRLRTGLLSMPMGIAPLLREREDVNEIAAIIEGRLTEALTELVNFDMAAFKAAGHAEFVAALEAEDNGEVDAGTDEAG